MIKKPSASFKRALREVLGENKPAELDIEGFILPDMEGGYVELDEAKTIPVPKGGHIRIEAPRHGGGGQVHGHVYGRKGEMVMVVNLDGTSSHGTKGRLTQNQASVLKANGFNIRADRMVEWFWIDTSGMQFLLG